MTTPGAPGIAADRRDAIWTSLPMPAFLLDADDRIAAVNGAAESFINVSARALVGALLLARLRIAMPMQEALAAVRRDQSRLFIDDVDVAGGAVAAVRCSLRVAPLSGHPDELLLIVEPRPVAGRLGSGETVRPAARSAIGMADMLSHEIKNPLAGITGAAQLLAMNLGTEDRLLTDLIVAESRRIVTLLEQVDRFGNLRPPVRRAVNLHTLLDRARRSALVGFGAHMRIVEAYDPSLPPTFADGDQLVQVFLNLLKNASEASDSNGTIMIRTFYDLGLRRRRKDGSLAHLPLQVEIVDDGRGLPPEIAADIFEPFVSGRENGSGLGLALVARIVADHDGWIAVESVPGRTVFRLSLPVATEAAKGEA